MLGWNSTATRDANEVRKAREDAIVAYDAERDLYEGNVQLEIRSFESFRQIDKYTKYLSTIENIRIVSESWSEDEGFRIFVSIQAPLSLERLLQSMPEVARVYFNGYKSSYGGLKKGYPKMVVEMRATEPSLEPVLV
jgi:hypothetical protein